MSLRFAQSADVQAMLAIYAQYIATPITFETSLPAESEFRLRLERVQAAHPWIVAEDGSGLVGYAYAHCPWERAAYRWNAELSVYVRRENLGQGTGTRLYAAMLELLRAQHVRVALGCITVPNEASIALHSRFGFTESARFQKAGWKNGAWHDVVWLSLPLADDDHAPLPRIPAPELPQALIQHILADSLEAGNMSPVRRTV